MELIIQQNREICKESRMGHRINCGSSAFSCVFVVAKEYSKENSLSLMQQRSSTKLETTSLSTDVALWFSLEYSVATTYPA